MGDAPASRISEGGRQVYALGDRVCRSAPTRHANMYLCHTAYGTGLGPLRHYRRKLPGPHKTLGLVDRTVAQALCAHTYRKGAGGVDANNQGRHDGGVAPVHDVWPTEDPEVRKLTEITFGFTAENAYRAWLNDQPACESGRSKHLHRDAFAAMVDPRDGMKRRSLRPN